MKTRKFKIKSYVAATSILLAALINYGQASALDNNNISTVNSNKKNMTSSIYDIEINSINGEKINLEDFKGKKILFVNVASKCGYTSQYEELQKLYEKNNDKLVIIGVPCNQFGMQEPGTSVEILNFCKKNYGVSFPLTEKINVKGNSQHPLYKWLTSRDLNGFSDTQVSWNFQKYLINEEGKLLKMFPSNIKPLDNSITSLL